MKKIFILFSVALFALICALNVSLLTKNNSAQTSGILNKALADGENISNDWCDPNIGVIPAISEETTINDDGTYTTIIKFIDPYPIRLDLGNDSIHICW